MKSDGQQLIESLKGSGIFSELIRMAGGGSIHCQDYIPKEKENKIFLRIQAFPFCNKMEQCEILCPQKRQKYNKWIV